jgi:hypothetical protein
MTEPAQKLTGRVRGTRHSGRSYTLTSVQCSFRRVFSPLFRRLVRPFVDKLRLSICIIIAIAKNIKALRGDVGGTNQCCVEAINFSVWSLNSRKTSVNRHSDTKCVAAVECEHTKACPREVATSRLLGFMALSDDGWEVFGARIHSHLGWAQMWKQEQVGHNLSLSEPCVGRARRVV